MTKKEIDANAAGNTNHGIMEGGYRRKDSHHALKGYSNKRGKERGISLGGHWLSCRLEGRNIDKKVGKECGTPMSGGFGKKTDALHRGDGLSRKRDVVE